MTTFALDAFDGAGNLSTHNADVGGAWQVALVGDVLSSQTLDSGRVHKEASAGSSNCPAVLSPPAQPGTSDYYLEIEGYRNGTSLTAHCGICAYQDLTNYYGVECFVYADGSIAVHFNSPVGGNQYFDYAAGSLPVGSFTLRVEVSGGGTQFAFLFNGSQFYSTTIASMPVSTFFGIAASQITPRMEVANFIAASSAATQAPAFWTDFQRTYEVP